MRASRFLTCVAVALLGVVSSGSTVSAQFWQCRQVSAVVNVGANYNGVRCDGITYVNMAGKVVKSTTCTCQSTLCPHFVCSNVAGTVCRIAWTVTNAYCIPNR